LEKIIEFVIGVGNWWKT